MTKTSSTESTVELPFKLESIAKAVAPGGAEGVWHSYVITQGTNTIEGVRAGTHAQIPAEVEALIAPRQLARASG
jgi:hypothetical protein